jgi:4-amino-4-deoxy-L-arabinose transferase-like glycosyltransferase
MANKFAYILAIFLLLFMFILAVTSIVDDSLTMDELAHLPAGYSYLTQKDMRLNPEHPPLIKDLAAFPLLFIEGIKFPSEIKDWQRDLNGQWGFGNIFLFKSGNPADKMIFWARIPMILLMIFLGYFVFKWARELFGERAALLALFFYSFSPTFLAHGRLITTDVAAAVGAVLATYYFIRFLQKPDNKSIILAGISFAIAQLFKFSLILLYPFFAIIFLAWIIFKIERAKIRQFLSYGMKIVLIFIVAFIVIWPVYFYHVLNLPTERIKDYAQEFLKHHPLNKISKKIPLKIGGPIEIVNWMAEKPILKPWSYYLLGVFMATERAAGGHTTYFMGEVSASGWVQYFPIVYLIKEPLAFQILTIIVLLFFAYSIKKPFWQQTFSRFKSWIKNHFVEFTFLVWLLIYWGTSLSSNLNIGVRHLLPIFPFVHILVAGGIAAFLKSKTNILLQGAKYLILFVLILWQIISVIAISPHFLSYFNEIAGGPQNGHIYTVNSNLDWGQDLKRLKKWVEEEKIDKIYVDYFGGADTGYYLGEKVRSWQGTHDPEKFPRGNYLAVSVSFLQGGKGQPVKGFGQPSGYYLWLEKYQPIKKIGHSIFVYYID